MFQARPASLYCRNGGEVLFLFFLYIQLLGVCVNLTLKGRIPGCLVPDVEETDLSPKTEVWAGCGDTHL